MRTGPSLRTSKCGDLAASRNRFGHYECSRVFVRACQQVNGWENQLWRFEGSDFVPPALGRDASPRRPRRFVPAAIPGPKLEDH